MSLLTELEKRLTLASINISLLQSESEHLAS
jgi:hypothetical protein